jgi:carboxypeptidase D
MSVRLHVAASLYFWAMKNGSSYSYRPVFGHALFQNIAKKIPALFGIKNFKIYVTGESYAGRYVPYIADAMLEKQNETYYNVSGILVYDPCIGSYTYTNNAFINKFVHDNNNVLGFNDSFIATLDEKHESCGYAEFIEDYLVFPPNGSQPEKYFNTTADADCDTWVSMPRASRISLD